LGPEFPRRSAQTTRDFLCLLYESVDRSISILYVNSLIPCSPRIRQVEIMRAHSESRERHRKLSRSQLELNRSHGGIDRHSADEVISEMSLVLVVTLGAVLAVNMVLLALHVG
jgi:hypothetical protein